MKKTIVLLCLSILFSVSLSAQIKFDVSVKYNTEATGKTGDVTITVTSGEADFVYALTSPEPINATIIDKSEKTKKTRYTFKGVKPGLYFVKVEDASGIYAFQSVKIDDTIVTQ